MVINHHRTEAVIAADHREAVFVETLALLRCIDAELPEEMLVRLAHMQTDFRLLVERLRAEPTAPLHM